MWGRHAQCRGDGGGSKRTRAWRAGNSPICRSDRCSSNEGGYGDPEPCSHFNAYCGSYLYTQSNTDGGPYFHIHSNADYGRCLHLHAYSHANTHPDIHAYGNAVSNSDQYANGDSYSHTDADTDPYADAYSYGNTVSNSDKNANPDSYLTTDTHIHTLSHADCDVHTYAHSSTQNLYIWGCGTRSDSQPRSGRGL